MQTLEKQKYEEMWTHEGYRLTSPGFDAACYFFDHFKDKVQKGDSILDLGCGTGRTGALFFSKGLLVRMIDIAANCLDENIVSLTHLFPNEIQFLQVCLWKLPSSLKPVDWIYCCDVLEHLPQHYIDKAFYHMAKRMKKGGFLQIFLKDEPFGLMIGKRLHLTIQSKEWWIDKISTYWEIEDFGPEVKGGRFTVFIKNKKDRQ